MDHDRRRRRQRGDALWSVTLLAAALAANEGRGILAAIGMRTTKRSHHRRGLYVALACLLTACSDGDQAGEVSTATSDRAVEVSSTSVASDERVVAAIGGFDVTEPANVGSRSALTIMVLTEPESTRATAKNLVGSDDPDVRLAAIYALSINLQS
jgi:hypothetical protein